ncbi:oncoprotein-induced transcript 3 protein-like [Haliotis rufescens]|uniref:oncoprotein-induced transcript 3 protein-like n=1 Tax=Haliotis rufescens TaxID=6454 RepID=UPI00201E8AEB|nr:oncoprotein-induced transcript 3 protein-like [Haliotis rufescens]
MARRSIRWVVLWICYVVVENENPCSDYKNLTLSGDRNPQCPYDKNNDKCDLYIKENWFRPQDDQGNFPAMSAQCVPPSSCGSLYPIWLNGPHPSDHDGVVNITACISTHADCCEHEHTMQVMNCSIYYVYYLVHPITCPARYCFESDLPCPTSTTWTSSTSVMPSNTTDSDNASHVRCSKYKVAVTALFTLTFALVVQTPL